MQDKNGRNPRGDDQAGQQPRKAEPRYPKGCPIDGHEGFGCTCNPIPGR